MSTTHLRHDKRSYIKDQSEGLALLALLARLWLYCRMV